MRTFRCYLPLPGLQINEYYPLTAESSHHLAKVLRAQEGLFIELFDGKGHRYQAQITSISKIVTVIITSSLESKTESPLDLHLMVAVGKGDKMDWIIQKATELGVNYISPVITRYSEVRLDESRWQKKLQHWQETIIHACEQCERDYLPILNPVQTFSEVIKQALTGNKFLLHPRIDTQPLPNQTINQAHLFIGPEGGFSETEVEQATKSGFETLSLGPRILRMETAALAAISILQNKYGDM